MFLEFLTFTIILFIFMSRNIHFKYIQHFYFRLIITHKSAQTNRIVYKINPTAGLANTLRGMASTIFLSYLYNSSFTLKGWKSILYYFNFPIELIDDGCNNNSIEYKKFNISLLNILTQKQFLVELTDIHGFLDKILYSKYNNKNVNFIKRIYSIKRINKRIINNIIYNEFFIPSNNINYYLNKFQLKKKNKEVLGIHIRSGLFYNNFSEKYFSGNVNIYRYLAKASQIIKRFNIVYVYTISDNEKYLNMLRSHFRNILLEIPFKGNIIHSRFSLYKSKINNNAIRIVSEFIILSNCDYIIGTRRSSFSSESCTVNMKHCILI